MLLLAYRRNTFDFHLSVLDAAVTFLLKDGSF